MSLRDAAVEVERLHHDACMGEMLSVVQRGWQRHRLHVGCDDERYTSPRIFCLDAQKTPKSHRKRTTSRKETSNPVTFVCSRILRAG